MPKLQNFSVVRNTDETLSVLIESDLTVDTISGATVEWFVYDMEFGVPFESPLLIHKTTDNGSIVVPASPAMVFDIALARADTASLDVGVYYHEAIVVDAANNRTQVMYGAMAVTLSLE